MSWLVVVEHVILILLAFAMGASADTARQREARQRRAAEVRRLRLERRRLERERRRLARELAQDPRPGLDPPAPDGTQDDWEIQG